MREEQSDEGNVFFFSGVVEGGGSAKRLDFQVWLFSKENFNDFGLVLCNSTIDCWLIACGVCVVDLGAVGEEELDEGDINVFDCIVEGCHRAWSLRFDIVTVGEEEFDQVYVGFARSGMFHGEEDHW